MPTSPVSPSAHSTPVASAIPQGLTMYLRQVLDSLDVFVGLLTPDGTLVEANYTALAAAGLRPEDVLGKPFEDTYWWSYSPSVQAQLRAAIEQAAGGERVRYDVVVRLAEDHFITIDFRLVPLFDPDGRVQFLIPSAVDITERLQASRQLRESEARFRATFEQAAVGIAHVGLDGQWLRVNQKLCDIVGYSHDELLQRTFQDITYPPDLDIDLAYVQQLLAGEIAAYSLEKRYLRRDGSMVWVNLTGSLVRDAAGAPSYFIAIIEDISERRSAREALRQSEERLQRAAQAAGFGMYELDLTSGENFWSPELKAIFGLPLDAPVPLEGVGLFIHPLDRDRVLETLLQSYDPGGAGEYEAEHRIVRPDGTVRWVLSRGRTQFAGEGAARYPVRVSGVVIDTTTRHQVEEALRDSEERLRLAAEAAHMYAFEWRPETDLVLRSAECGPILGLTEEPTRDTGADYFARIHPEDHGTFIGLLQVLSPAQPTYHTTYRVVRPDGGIVALEETGHAFFDPTGRMTRLVGMTADVTEREQAEVALRLSEIRFRTALAGSPVTVFNQDRDLRYTWIYNPSAGYEVETVLGKTDADILERPDEVASLTALKQQVMTSGVGVRQEVLIHSGPQANYFDLAIEPLRDDDGHIVGITASSTDITHRKLAEERQRLLAEASAVLSSSLDYETTLQGVARLALPMFADYCAVYLIEEDERIRQVAVAHVDPAKEAALREGWRDYPLTLQSALPIARVLRTGRPDLVADVSRGLRASLEQTFLEQAQTAMVRELPATSYIIVPLVIRGEVIGGLAFVWAESARHYDADDLDLARELAHRAALAIDNARLYQQAQEAIQVREEFLSIASHELKTPITSLQLQMQLLLMHTRRGTLSHLPAERLAKIVETGEQQVKRLAVLVNDLLDVSRISAQGLELRREQTDLAQIVEAVVERFGPEAAGQGSVLRVQAAPAVGHWDPNRLEQVAVNLLSNAIKYGAGRPIEVSLTSTSTAARLVVRDQGIGIPPDRLPHIFDRFERAVADMTYSGIGLGLYITRQIVEGHGGSIHVESVPHQGSTFTVELPLAS